MKSVIYLTTALLVISTPAYAAKTFRPITHKINPENQGPKLRVLLAENCNSALIEAKGGYRVVDKANGAILSRGSSGKRYIFHALTNGLRWGEEYPDSYQITIKPTTKESSLFVNGIQYKGAITVCHCAKNRITLVNEVPIEELLLSLLSSKFDLPLAEEAMAALAIVERTKLYAHYSGQKAAWGIDCSKEELGYEGHGITKKCVGIEQAVDATRFMVMEGIKTGKVVPRLAEIEELAHKGLDAKQILSSYCPGVGIGLTTKIPSKIIR